MLPLVPFQVRELVPVRARMFRLRERGTSLSGRKLRSKENGKASSNEGNTFWATERPSPLLMKLLSLGRPIISARAAGARNGPVDDDYNTPA